MGMIIKEIKMPYGVTFNDAYFKISRLSYNDENKELYFAGEFYVNINAQREGFKPIENGILCELIKLEDKTVNMYEYIYNYIKQKSVEVTSMTKEEIDAHNKKIIDAAGMVDGPITGLINLNYALFKDAIDA